MHLFFSITFFLVQKFDWKQTPQLHEREKIQWDVQREFMNQKIQREISLLAKEDTPYYCEASAVINSR